MSDPAAPDVVEEGQANNNHPHQDGLTELRRLLVGPEQQELVQLRQRLDRQDSLLPGDVGRVLPERGQLRSRKDRKITQALMPTVEEAIGISVKRNPQTLVDALFPVMGPAIRKAISEALSGMVQ